MKPRFNDGVRGLLLKRWKVVAEQLGSMIHHTFLQKLSLLRKLSLESGLKDIYRIEKGLAGQPPPDSPTHRLPYWACAQLGGALGVFLQKANSCSVFKIRLRWRLPLGTQSLESLSCDLLGGFPNILKFLESWNGGLLPYMVRWLTPSNT